MKLFDLSRINIGWIYQAPQTWDWKSAIGEEETIWQHKHLVEITSLYKYTATENMFCRKDDNRWLGTSFLEWMNEELRLFAAAAAESPGGRLGGWQRTKHTTVTPQTRVCVCGLGNKSALIKVWGKDHGFGYVK